jgi:glycine cleavage system regulatory protein
MQRSLVMTIIGPDRPGLVESVASIVAAHRGNWLESRMTRLGGFFAGVLRVDVPTAQEQELSRALETLKSRGLEVVVHPDTAAPPAAAGKLQCLEVVGQDRPGIVRQIAEALARFGVNVEELHTETSSAAMSGETLFRASALLYLPPACDVSQLQTELEKIAADLIVDVSLTDSSSPA